LNALAGADRAIVTDIAGTTRDLLRERLRLDGIELTLVDTAGLRESADPVEAEGICRARHLEALARTAAHLDQAAARLGEGAGELAAEELRLAQDALGELTGRVDADALLGRIFSSFCIGK
jgi:tRNA modification GTPase